MSEKMNLVAVIPARGGSKRIPRKNIRLFAGKPILAYSVAAARESGLFHRILVSTEDEEIAAVARECGAEVPFMRPAELADDHVGADAVFLHALEWLEARGQPADYACCIQATAPLLEAGDLRAGYEKMREAGAAASMAVAPFRYPIFRAMKVNERGRLQMIWPEHRGSRSQDLPVAYQDAAQFYWVEVARYEVLREKIWDEAVPIVLPAGRVQDIDTLEDWELAERLFEAARLRRRTSAEPSGG